MTIHSYRRHGPGTSRKLHGVTTIYLPYQGTVEYLTVPYRTAAIVSGGFSGGSAMMAGACNIPLSLPPRCCTASSIWIGKHDCEKCLTTYLILPYSTYLNPLPDYLYYLQSFPHLSTFAFYNVASEAMENSKSFEFSLVGSRTGTLEIAVLQTHLQQLTRIIFRLLNA